MENHTVRFSLAFERTAFLLHLDGSVVIESTGHFWHRSSVSSYDGHVLTIVKNGQNSLQVRHVRGLGLGRCSLVRGAPWLNQ